MFCRRHQSLRRVARKICVLRDALEVGMDRVAKHSERDHWFAFKKRAAQVLLQSAYGICQRRLRDAATSGRPRETALLMDRQKIPIAVASPPPHPLWPHSRLAIGVESGV